MASNFDSAYEPLKKFEGEWCHVAGDRGGETYRGIARKFWPGWEGWLQIDAAKDHSSFGEGRIAFSKHLAAATGLSKLVAGWYKKEWWERMGLAKLPQAVADEIFEQAVNMGMGGATRYLQRLCNAYKRGRDGSPFFDDLVVDGAIGNKTLDAIVVLLDKRIDPAEFAKRLNSLQCVHYINLASKNSSQRKFVDGWMKRTI